LSPVFFAGLSFLCHKRFGRHVVIRGSRREEAFNVARSRSGKRRRSLCAPRWRRLLFEHYEPRTLLATLTNTGTAADVVYTLPATADSVYLEDDVTSGNGMLQLRSNSGTFNTTVFANPPGSLTINRGNAADSITINNLLSTDFSASLNIGAAGVEFSSVTFAGSLTLAADNNLWVNATGTISLPFSTSKVAVSGTGSISLTTAQNIPLGFASAITSVNGTITLSANQQTSPTSGKFVGVEAKSATIQATGTGAVVVRGKGGDDSGGSQYGVHLSVATVKGGTGGVQLTGVGGGSGASTTNAGVFVDALGQVSAAGSGAVIVQGTGGAGSGGSNYGVWLRNSAATITSSGGNVQITGQGGSAGGSDTGVFVDSSGLVTAGGSGTVTVQGTGGAGSGDGNYGIAMSLSSVITSSGGNVQLTGQGGGSGTSSRNDGVALEYSSQVTSAGSGTVTVHGTGGATSGNLNAGVSVFNSAAITSSGGNVQVTGQGGGAGASGGDFGIDVGYGQISAGGGGAVTVQGTGGAAAGGSNHGVSIGPGLSITSSGGNVQVTGVGGGSGTSGFNEGVHFLSGQISAGGTGAVAVQGSGGAGSSGGNIGVNLSLSDSSITSSGGNVQVTGIEGTGTSGINVSVAVSVSEGTISTASNGGTLTLIGNSMSFDNTSTISASATSSITLRPFTAGVAINLGLAADPIGGPLGLTDSELDRITAGTVNIGDANSGTITVSATIDRSSPTAMNLTSGGSINYTTGSINTNGGNLTLAPGAAASVGVAKTGNDVNLGSNGTLSFTTGSDLAFAINGKTADTQYQQLNVVGKVDLTGADLVLAGTYTPVVGDSFTIVNNDGTDAITGTFNGLPEGKVFTIPSGTQAGTYQITCQGGDGNDVVLTAIDPANPVLQGTSGDDNWLIKRNFGNLDVFLNGVRVFSPPFSSLASPSINSLAGNDTLTVDLSGGDAIPSGNITFNGGDSSLAPGDKLMITGGQQVNDTYNFSSTSSHDGNIVMELYGTVNYTSLEAIKNTGSAQNVIFNLPSDQDITLGDDDNSGNSISRLSGGTFAPVDFANPIGVLTIAPAGNSDTLTVNSLPDMNAGIYLAATFVGAFSAITFAGAMTTGGISMTAEAVDFQAAASIIVPIGDLQLTADSLNIDPAATISVQQDYAVYIDTLSVPAISLGSEVTGQLSLTDAELDRIAAGAVQIGDGQSDDTISVTGPISNSNSLGLTSSDSINVSQVLSSSAGIGLYAPVVRLGANAAIVTSGSDGIIFTADSIDISPTASVNAGSSNVTIGQRFVPNVNLGTKTTGELSLTDAELDRITAGSLEIGDFSTGATIVSANITRPTATAVTLISASYIEFAGGSFDTGGGNLVLRPADSLYATTAGNDIIVGPNANVSFAGGSNLRIGINGEIVDSQYNQLNVVGNVDLTGVNLVIEVGFQPLVGNQFTIINNVGSGTTTGQFQNVEINGPGSLLNNLQLGYSRGDGNDVVLTTVNIAPTLDPIFNPNPIDEDTGIQMMGLTGLSAGNDGTHILKVTAASSNLSLIPKTNVIFSALAGTGTLTYTPLPDQFGSTVITVTVQDDGPAATNTFSRTFTVVVNPVNDPPSFTSGANQSAFDEHAHGPALEQVVPNWATNVVAGPSNESSQHLTFHIESDNHAIFAVQPEIDVDGKLHYTPMPNAHGVATLIVTLQDDAGGADRSPSQQFTIEIKKLHKLHNATETGGRNGLDVTGSTSTAPDGFINPSDALAVINYINAKEAGSIPASVPIGAPYVDVNGDDQVIAQDVLDIINWINAHSGQPEAEADAASQPVANNLPSDLISLLALDISEHAARRRRLQ
jgi:hypothetical protein